MAVRCERHIVAMLLYLLFCVAAAGQSDPVKDKAISQMRQVAKAVKECPQAVSDEAPPNSKCFDTKVAAGPPLNVSWDLAPSKNARAPYLGWVEFDLPGTWTLDALQPSDRKVAKACERDYSVNADIAAMWARAGLRVQLGLANDIEPPQSGVWHYRFEFDVGTDDPELVKMLWSDATGKDLHPVTDNHSCWAKAAQSIGVSKPTQLMPSQAKDK